MTTGRTGEQITAAAIIKTPPPGMVVPARCSFSPEGRYLGFLSGCEQGGGERLDERKGLFVCDLADGTTHKLLASSEGLEPESLLTLEEELARERDRERDIGVTEYAWAPHGQTILVRLRNCFRIIAVPTAETVCFYRHEAPLFFPTFSPDASRVAFVSGNDLWCVDLPGPGQDPRAARRLTDDGSDTRLYGIADQMTWEELGRGKGFWWGSDSKTLFFTRTDLGHIPAIATISDDPQRTEQHRYVFPGAPLPHWTLFSQDIDTGSVEPLDTDTGEDGYLIDVALYPGRSRSLCVRTTNRRQDRLDVLEVPMDGRAKVLFSESARPWINIHDGPNFLGDDGAALWCSEATGMVRLALRDPAGKLRGLLPAPTGTIREVVGIDQTQGFAYFLASNENPTEQHLYRCGLEPGSKLECLTHSAGWHLAVMDPCARVYAHTFSSVDQAPVFEIAFLDGTRNPIRIASRDDRPERFALRPPLLKKITADDGKTDLYCALYRPYEMAAGGNPVLVAVYGGPHQQAVINGWSMTCDMRAQRFAQQGYFVLKVDNRGSWGRGSSFETPVHGQLGRIELRDQVHALLAVAAEQSGLDLGRVGVYGWSYGGYMAALCMMREPRLFKVGVAGAPVVRWDLYDAAYTERYMGLPAASEDDPGSGNASGYAASSLLGDVAALQGDLLVIHGTRDENVLFAHSLALLRAAAAAGKRIDLLLLADERHAIRKGKNRAYLEERTFEYLNARLEQGGWDAAGA